MHRLCVAIRPPGVIRDLLIDAMEDSPELRWVGDEQLHLTLRFIGEVERPRAGGIAPRPARCCVRAPGGGSFERRSGGTLWAGIEPNQPLAALAAKVERACVAAGLE